jgi:hypothetical protein
VPCFYTEDIGLRLAALTVLPVETLCVAEMDGVGYWEKTLSKSTGASVDSLEEWASFN